MVASVVEPNLRIVPLLTRENICPTIKDSGLLLVKD
jgi:hypothetical protein